MEATSPTLETKSPIVEIKSVEAPPPQAADELITPVTEVAVVPMVEPTPAPTEPVAPVAEACVPEVILQAEQDLSEQKSQEIDTSKDSSNLGILLRIINLLLLCQSSCVYK
jgi:hypothetical protein